MQSTICGRLCRTKDALRITGIITDPFLVVSVVAGQRLSDFFKSRLFTDSLQFDCFQLLMGIEFSFGNLIINDAASDVTMLRLPFPLELEFYIVSQYISVLNALPPGTRLVFF